MKELKKVGSKGEFDGLFVNAFLVNGNENDVWVGTSNGLFKLSNGINGVVDVFRKGKGKNIISLKLCDILTGQKRNAL